MPDIKWRFITSYFQREPCSVQDGLRLCSHFQEYPLGVGGVVRAGPQSPFGETSMPGAGRGETGSEVGFSEIGTWQTRFQSSLISKFSPDSWISLKSWVKAPQSRTHWTLSSAREILGSPKKKQLLRRLWTSHKPLQTRLPIIHCERRGTSPETLLAKNMMYILYALVIGFPEGWDPGLIWGLWQTCISKTLCSPICGVLFSSEVPSTNREASTRQDQT